MRGLYTVVIPTRNRRDMLLTTLSALGKQEDLELLDSCVVVDDHSTDDTVKAVQALQLGIRVRLLHSPGRGASVTRNAGAQAAESKYILFLDDDCEPSPVLLREHHRRRAGVDVLHCVRGRVDWPPATLITPFMAFIDEYYQCGLESLKGKTEVEFDGLLSDNLSIERELFLKHGGFDADFLLGFEDTDLGVRLTQAGVRVLYAKRALAYHHRPPDLQSYCVRQEIFGEGAIVFARKHPDHPEVVRLDRMPHPCSVRGIAKALLVNSLTEHPLGATAGLLDRIGLSRISAPIYFQLLSYHYYRGVRKALRRAGTTVSELHAGRP